MAERVVGSAGTQRNGGTVEEDDYSDIDIHLQQGNQEFIRKLANDYIHFRIYGPETNTMADLLDAEEITNSNEQVTTPTSPPRRIPRYRRAFSDSNNNATTDDNNESSSFKKTAKILRKVSVEIERNNAQFFDSVCNNLNLEQGNPERAFKIVSEEVLSHETLNWGRVVSLFTFGGKLAEWFWSTQQHDKLDDLEDWLAESLSTKEEWIEQRGGWENFNETFGENQEVGEKFNWLKPGLLMCVGVSIAALFTIKMQ